MADIRSEWDKADKLDAKADEQKWKVARLLSEANEAGSTYRVLAAETGRSHTTVGRWARTWRQLGTHRGSRSFNECLEEVRSETRESRQDDRDRSATRRVARENPEEAAEIVAEEQTRELFRRSSNDTDRQALRLRLDRQAKKREEESNSRVGFRSIEFSVNNTKIRNLLATQLKLAQNVELPAGECERGVDALERIISAAKMIQLALQGSTDIDWDAEFSKLN